MATVDECSAIERLYDRDQCLSELAGKQLRLGPEALFAKFEKWGLYGIFPSHQWNVRITSYNVCYTKLLRNGYTFSSPGA